MSSGLYIQDAGRGLRPVPRPLVVSFGGGVNSAAMLIGLRESGVVPDAIVFSDTRGEKPETYAWQRIVLPQWLKKAGFPELTVVCRADFGRGNTGDKSLEDECLRLGTLPSRAYGFGTCADKWKIDPFKWWSNEWEPAKTAWAAGGVVTRAIGYDAGEGRRVSDYNDPGYGRWFPLIEWRWDRDACVAAVRRAGLPVPPKSACFYCPSSTKTEVLRLQPDLRDRAIAMEKRAIDSGRWAVKGLGRHFSWGQLVAADEAQQKLFPEAPVESCMMCSDGDPGDEAA